MVNTISVRRIVESESLMTGYLPVKVFTLTFVLPFVIRGKEHILVIGHNVHLAIQVQTPAKSFSSL